MAFSGRHRSNIAMNASALPRTGKMNVLCPPNVFSGPSPFCGFTPSHGLPSYVHGPQIESATAERAAFGAQPVQSEEIIQ